MVEGGYGLASSYTPTYKIVKGVVQQKMHHFANSEKNAEIFFFLKIYDKEMLYYQTIEYTQYSLLGKDIALLINYQMLKLILKELIIAFNIPQLNGIYVCKFWKKCRNIFFWISEKEGFSSHLWNAFFSRSLDRCLNVSLDIFKRSNFGPQFNQTFGRNLWEQFEPSKILQQKNFESFKFEPLRHKKITNLENT